MVGEIRRHELTDREWELLAPLIPRAVTRRPRVEDRKIINGMVYKNRTGISWRDLPGRGPACFSPLQLPFGWASTDAQPNGETDQIHPHNAATCGKRM
ncbi:transposase [Streptomyces griseorubiginosus]|uniref:transposase n=1 Tax=Streptomyces griseorubiginosus TaxID=67304 RepID=UPI0036880F6F